MFVCITVYNFVQAVSLFLNKEIMLSNGQLALLHFLSHGDINVFAFQKCQKFKANIGEELFEEHYLTFPWCNKIRKVVPVDL